MINQKVWLPYFLKQSEQQTITIFQFRIRGCIRFVAVAFRSEEGFWRRGPSLTYFCAALDPPLGGSGRKALTHLQGYDYFIPTKFGQHISICSVGKAMCSHTYTLWPEGEFKTGLIELYIKDYIRELGSGRIQDWANRFQNSIGWK